MGTCASEGAVIEAEHDGTQLTARNGSGAAPRSMR